jgi:hypothetical protein
MLHRKGLLLKDIQDYIGHKDIKTTASYIRNDMMAVIDKVDKCFQPEKSVKGEINVGTKKISLEIRIRRK